MRRVELNYQPKDQTELNAFNMEGNLYIKGIGTCQIESNNDPERTVSFSMISSLVDPRNARLLATLLPGQSYKVVRPTAILVIKNTEPA